MEQENPRTIMIVDDDLFLLDLYSSRFAQAGFTVETASSGKDALEKITKGMTPDILLLDVVMPSMDGFELVEALSQKALLVSTTKIFLTNLSREEDIVRGKSLGAAGYIIKAQSTPSDVVEQVRTILKQKELVQ